MAKIACLFYFNIHCCLFVAAAFIVANGQDVNSEDESTCAGYNACAAVHETNLNVHLISHSHDDVGWLKTVDQYFYGKNDSIQRAGVSYIIGSVVEALRDHPEGRFIQVETAFFWEWWNQQSDIVKDVVRNLVKEGRLEMINGAWSMNDEAAAHYQSIIDQFTLGLRFLNDAVGQCGNPRVGWQIDPFGHSSAMAEIFTSLGYEGVFFARLDYRDKNKRLNESNMDLIWRGNTDLGNSTDLFTSIFYDFYTQPAHFCWDILCSDETIIDDEESFDYNVERIVERFANLVTKQKVAFKTNNLVVPMGGDFTYQAANRYFVNIDKLIAGFKKFRPDINVFYSTPSCYIKAVNEAAQKNDVKYELKTDDFFPYASDLSAYWTGYFTSRPNSKRLERQGNNILQVVKQLATLDKVKTNEDHEHDLKRLERAMGVMQHHDAITGTEKQHVADDYSKMMDRAINSAQEHIDQIIIDLLEKDGSSADDVKVKFVSCLLANETHCDESKSDRFSVVIYNPSSWNLTHYVRLPVNAWDYSVKTLNGEEVEYDIVPTLGDFSYHEGIATSDKELVFAAKNLPALGLRYYVIEKLSDNIKLTTQDSDDLPLHFGTDSSGFNITENGLLSSVKLNGMSLDLTQRFMYYFGRRGSNMEGSRTSGAYIFRPNTTEPFNYIDVENTNVTLKTFKGKLVDEVHQSFGDYIKQVIRIYKNENYLEFDWLVGPIDVQHTSDGVEVISKFITDLDSNEEFYTDSNGRQMMKRKRNFRETYNYTDEEPVSANYYPITSMISLRTEEVELSVMVDRAEGGSSMNDGEIELMVHRRLLHDDAFGVGEALNEEQFHQGLVTRGTHVLTFGPTSATPHPRVSQKQLAQRRILSPWMFVADNTKNEEATFDKIKEVLNTEMSPLSEELDEKVQILTLEPWRNNDTLIRLENIVEKSADSSSVEIDLAKLFKGVEVTNVREMNLAANLPASKIKNKRMTWNTIQEENNQASQTENQEIENEESKETIISLKPQEIRTFIVNLALKKNVN